VGTLKKEKGPSVSWKWGSEEPQTFKTSGNSALVSKRWGRFQSSGTAIDD